MFTKFWLVVIEKWFNFDYIILITSRKIYMNLLCGSKIEFLTTSDMGFSNLSRMVIFSTRWRHVMSKKGHFEFIICLISYSLYNYFTIILLPFSSWKPGRFQRIFSFGNSHPIVRRVSRAPPHHTFPAFLNLDGMIDYQTKI